MRRNCAAMALRCLNHQHFPPPRRSPASLMVTQRYASPVAERVPPPGCVPLFTSGASIARRLEVTLTDDVLVVHGGAPLQGQIRVRGAKNLVSKAMFAALLGETPSRLYDVPRIRDVEVVRGLLELHGVKVSDGVEPGEIVLDPTNVDRGNVDEINVHAGSSRIPILFCGPLLHRLGHAF